MASDVRRWAWIAALIAHLALSACTPTRLDYESQTHVVKAGETLYTIAWQHGIDYRELAMMNGLSNPDLIVPGQRLRLHGPSAGVAATNTRPTGERTIPVTARPPQPAAAQPKWSWPTQGQIAARFGTNDGIGTGIAITGTSGQSILAAADGRVVYVGTGLVGYGQLVIVKHNEIWLSAYGHTEAVLVRQGDAVVKGERIASMGLGPRRQPRLHFEIRRDGAPVDPLALLPRLR